MLVRPLPGADRDHLLHALIEVSTEAINARNQSCMVAERPLIYIEWASNAIRRLWRLLSPQDLNRLVRTPAYWAVIGASTTYSPGLAALVEQELTERMRDFEDLCQATDSLLRHWSEDREYVLADTSFYIEHPEKLEDVDFTALIGGRPTAPIRLLIPIIIIDELDALKQHSNKHVRWRAMYTLAVFDRIFRLGRSIAGVRPEVDYETSERTGRLPRGEVTAEIVFDPADHVRLTINDAEIIERGLGIEILTGGTLTLVTYDTGQSTRARSAGLTVQKLAHPQGDEPKRQPRS